MVSIKMAPKAPITDPDESFVLKRLGLANCETPVLSEDSNIWEFPCGLAVSKELAVTVRYVKKALSAARNQHLVHPREGHTAQGRWAITIHRTELGFFRGANFKYRAAFDHKGVMA